MYPMDMKHPALRFPFNEKAATEAAVILVRAYGKPMRLWRLLKLLHLAERESLAHHGMPIFGGTYCSMELGPVPSEIYNLTKGEAVSRVWSSHILTRRYDKKFIEVSVAQDLPPAELTRGNIAALRLVQQNYLRMSTDALDRVMHGLPEYTPTKSSIRIEPADLLRRLGKSEEEIDRIRREVEEEAAFFRTHAGLRAPA
jgi:uncharacterized phage-associated protein